ncbi:SPFH domain-containing protein [bacterium]|nr:SPFH domain-containing protein [bacterium]
MNSCKEKQGWSINGFPMLLLVILLVAFGIWMIIRLQPFWIVVSFLLVGLLLPGFFVIAPNQARVLMFFGRYVGTVRQTGLSWTNPFTLKRMISLRMRNFNSEKLKVNDAAGNPIEIAAVIVWKVVDTAKAVFDVDHYEHFVAIQSETAIRSLANHYAYDAEDHRETSLRGAPDEVAETLKKELQARLSTAGVEVLEARITHLAYSPEIAQAMLRRQQAQAIIAARQKIVDGAVGMVEMAINRLQEQNLVTLDEERKASMVNNLLVVLVSENATQAVVNTGTIYS